MIPDPRDFDLPANYTYIEHEWGSLFFKHIGKMKRNDAKKICSHHGAHLPVPRFPDENVFYQSHFGNESLWLGLSDVEDRNDKRIYKSDHDDAILHFIIKRPGGDLSGSKYAWTDQNFTLNGKSTETPLTGVKLSNAGQWQMVDENETELDAICVYNIIPDGCKKCRNQNFCRYTDRSRSEVECICPVVQEGENCERDLCEGLQCINGGQCYLNDETRKAECICPYPFHGKNCVSSESYISHRSYFLTVNNVLR